MRRCPHGQESPPEDLSNRWVLCVLVTGDAEGVDAVTAEGLIKHSLWNNPAGAKPLVSTLARFADLSDDEQARWEARLRREADE